MDYSDAPISYIERIREYYLALGYETPYEWACHKDVPFTPLTQPLADCRVALVTTAAPYKPGAGDQGPGAPYNGAAKFFEIYEMDAAVPPDLRISHIAYDRQHSSATDINSWFPLQQLHRLADEGAIKAVCDKFFGLPTNRSQRISTERDGPMLVNKIVASGADVCILAPNCPVCHQSVSLAACQLEAAGIVTVVLGCARDIVEKVGVPRLLFSDFPLGNCAGKPHDQQSQYDTMRQALALAELAFAPRTTVQSPQQWSESSDWKGDYCNIARLSEQEIARRRSEFDQQKQRAKAVR